MNGFMGPFERIRRMQQDKGSGFRDFPGTGIQGREIIEPLIDIVDEGKKLRIVAEMPCVEKKDIYIELDKNSISISAEIRACAEEEDREKEHYYSERSYQSFSRTVPLPAEVKKEGAEAGLKNGILEITLEKKHPEEGRGSTRLEVK